MSALCYLRRVFVAGLVLAAALPAVASAALPRTYVDEATGTDSNDCTHPHPCLTFQHAHDVTSPGGELVALSAGNYSSLTITKPITIDGNNGQGTMTPFQYGVTVDLGAGGGTVVLRGLSINAGANSGIGGIDMVSGGTLITDHVRIVGGTVGILAENSTNPSARVIIDDTKIQAVSGPGVAIQPSGSRTVRATIRDSKIHDNTSAGIRLRPAQGAVARAVVRRTQIDENYNGILVDALGGTAVANVFGTGITDSGFDGGLGLGIYSNGVNATVRLSRDEIVANTRGLQSSNGGRILSTGDNDIFGNVENGAPTGRLDRG